MNKIAEAFTELERGVKAALETYSNVHRGSGRNSLVSTHLYERARSIVLEHLGLNKEKYIVIFGTPRWAELIKAVLKPGSYQIVSSQDVGLPLGVRALAVERKALPRGVPFQTGGGTARLVSPGWVIWAKAPDKFEAGTEVSSRSVEKGKGGMLTSFTQYHEGAHRRGKEEHRRSSEVKCGI